MTPKEYRAARESAGVSVLQMAKLLGVTRKTMYRREMPGAIISQEMAIAQRQVLRRIRSDHIAGVEPVKPARKPHKKRRKRRAQVSPVSAEPIVLRLGSLSEEELRRWQTTQLAQSEQPINPTPDNPSIP